MRAPSRRQILGGLLLPALAPRAVARPAHPQSLTLLLTTEGIEASGVLVREFLQSRPDLVSKLVLRQEDTGWLATGFTGAVRAESAGADVVLTNAAGFALGATQDIWQPLPVSLLAEAERQLTPAGRLLTPMAQGAGAVLGAVPGGPFLLHRPSVIPSPPRSAAELMDFARQNPGRFQYTRPRESLLGQLFVTGLPHLLGDRDPADPQTGWQRSWEYLREIGRHVSYYPSSGAAAMDEFSEGGCDLAPGLLGQFLFARHSGQLPPETACAALANAPVIPQGYMLAVPRGVPEARFPIIEAIGRFLLAPRAQMSAFGRGLLPGLPEGEPPPPDAVGAEERARWTGAMTPELAAELAGQRMAPPLGPFQLTYMLRQWDELVGAHFGENR